MDARGGGKVQGNVSVVAGFTLPRPQPQKAGRQDLADLSEPLGGGHKVGVEGVVQNRYLRGRDDTEDKRGWFKRTMMSDS
jgi:hypothetical protein